MHFLSVPSSTPTGEHTLTYHCCWLQNSTLNSATVEHFSPKPSNNNKNTACKRTKGKKRICSSMNTPAHFCPLFFANFYGLFNKTQRYISGSGVSRKTGRGRDCKGWKGLARVIGKVSLTCELSAKIGICPRKLRGNCRERCNINSNIPRKFAFM